VTGQLRCGRALPIVKYEVLNFDHEEYQKKEAKKYPVLWANTRRAYSYKSIDFRV
jgi:hypothetical protein